jgi:hypothetical protein
MKEKPKFRWWAAWIWLGYSFLDVGCKLLVVLSWGKVNPKIIDIGMKIPSAWKHSDEYWEKVKEKK